MLVKPQIKNVTLFLLLLTSVLFLTSTTPLKAACTNPEMEITVQATNFSYNVSAINLPTNTCVQIKLDNASSTFHTLTVDEFNGVAGFSISAGANSVSSQIILTSSTEIATKFYCEVGGHRSFGLEGDYIITKSTTTTFTATTSNTASTGTTTSTSTTTSTAPTSTSTTTSTAPTSTSTTASTSCISIDQILVVETGDLSFNVSEVVLKLDSCVMLIIKNVSPIFHTFTATSTGAFSGINIDALANQDTSLTFRTPKTPISTEFYCSVGGHRAAGMGGSLLVRNETPSQTTTSSATSSSTNGAVFFAIASLVFAFGVVSLASITLSRRLQKHRSN